MGATFPVPTLCYVAGAQFENPCLKAPRGALELWVVSGLSGVGRLRTTQLSHPHVPMPVEMGISEVGNRGYSPASIYLFT